MSHQPSTVESIKETANTAYESVATKSRPEQPNDDYDPKKDKANFKKDSHGNTVKKGGLKDKLDEVATGGPAPKEESYIEKVAAYIPGMNILQQPASQDQGGEEDKKPSGPPKRPDHDVQVEQFLRGQYHSRSGDGMPDPSSKD